MSVVAGKSIIEILWEEMDDVMDLISESREPTQDHNGLASFGDVQEWAELRGRAQGVAYALAVLTNPFSPSVPGIKAEARERWRNRQDAV